MKKKTRHHHSHHFKSLLSKPVTKGKGEKPYFMFFVFICALLILAILQVLKPAMANFNGM